MKTLSLSPEAIQKRTRFEDRLYPTTWNYLTNLFLPLYVTGGFTNIHTVPEQSIPNRDFPTVASANPEEPAAFKMALDPARKIDADLAMACDPDGDRIGIAVKNDAGEWTLLNGNQTNIIFTEYIIRRKKKRTEPTLKVENTRLKP